MAEMPRMDDDIYQDDFFVVTDDPGEQMVNVAFVERGFVMRFDYEELIEFASVVEQTRAHVQRRLDRAGRDGR
jgi:hypothetical protein